MTRLFTSESVTPGHPDKVCDQISDAILDEYLYFDPAAHVAVEVMAHAGGIVIGGEVSSCDVVPHEDVARTVLQQIGYREETGLDPFTVPIVDVTTAQSREIADGVNESLEYRTFGLDIDELDAQGAGDQGLMFGYATDETPSLMPLPISIAHDLASQLTTARRFGTIPFLRPDGKTQVTVETDNDGRPFRIDTILVSTQHHPTVSASDLDTAVRRHVIEPVLGAYRDLIDATNPRVLVNPSGSFILGGPLADTGLTGRKIIVDTYGGAARHGGGAFSGKDPSKVDRSGAYAARWVAKNIVAAGLAHRCEVQIAYAIDAAHPVGVFVETFGTGVLNGNELEALVREVFDLRPAAIIRHLDLQRPIYQQTATFGHFGRLWSPWEALDKVEALRAAVGATGPHAAARI